MTIIRNPRVKMRETNIVNASPPTMAGSASVRFTMPGVPTLTQPVTVPNGVLPSSTAPTANVTPTKKTTISWLNVPGDGPSTATR